MRANDGKTSSAGTVLLGIIAFALAGTAGTVGLARQVGALGPRIGDIVAFEPLDPIARDVRARLPAVPAEDRPGVACVLDVRAMHASGGSLVVESREPHARFGYRVHWSGTRTSHDGADCGASADLLVTLRDLEVLAIAAGGYGVPADRRSSSFWRTASAAP